ncbi:MAG: Gfo/Idh/MocA family oxidoreductase [Lentisphaeria bacterium]|nr:Gfo/Idh/MocA family oxidoreductase [Lentisphaeria bacterium]
MTKHGKIKVGIWGLGRAGYGMHIGEIGRYPDEFEIVAGCDLLPERCEMFAARVPEARTYTDSGSFLRDPEMELVVVAVRSPDHVECDIQALEAGYRVFAEKPVALTVAGGERLRQAAERHPGKLFLRHNRRFEAAFAHIREIIASGILGEVYEIKLCRHDFQIRDDWQAIVGCGGGQLNNWGPHIIDHALRLLDAPVESVWSDLKRIAARGDAEDHLKVVLRGRNRRIVDLEISGGVAIPGPVYTVYGTRGTLVCADEQDIRLRYLHPDCAEPTHVADPGTPPLNGGFSGRTPLRWIRKTIMVEPASGHNFYSIYHELYRAIRDSVPFPITVEQALEVVRVTNEIKRQNPEFPLCPDN